LRTTRSSALRERTATINQIKAMLISGPESLRARYRDMSNTVLTTALAASRPTKEPVTAEEATAYSLAVSIQICMAHPWHTPTRNAT